MSFDAEYYNHLSLDYRARRDSLLPVLAEAGFKFSTPEGAYYVLADYREALGDVEPIDAVRRLIDRARINAVPGHLFHARPDGVRTMRFHFAVADPVLDEVCARLQQL